MLTEIGVMLARSYKQLEVARKGSPLEPLRECSLADTLVLDLWPPNCENTFLLF